MSDTPATLFAAYDRGLLSRRQLLQALGLAVAPVALSSLAPAASFAQGQCGGARAGHAGMRPDARQAAIRADGMEDGAARSLLLPGGRLREGGGVLRGADELEIRSDDGKQAMLDIGDWGGLVIRGGYSRRRRLRRPPPPADPRRRGGRGAAGRAPRGSPRSTASAGASSRGTRRRWKPNCGSAASIRWPTTTERLPELPRQGPGRLRSADQQRQSRRIAARAPRPARCPRRRRLRRPTGRRCGSITSRSRHRTTRRPAAFYHALLGWKLGTDEGSQNSCEIGDIGGIIIRRGNRRRRGGGARRSRGARRSVTSRSASRRSIRMR